MMQWLNNTITMMTRLTGALLLFMLAACEKPLRFPHIPPQLQNWPIPYKGVAGLRLHVFQTGTIEVPAKMVYRDGSLLQRRTLDILVFAIEHPRHGVILFGTGLNRAIANGSDQYRKGFLGFLSKSTLVKGQEIPAQLRKARLSPEKVQHIIVPDLRFVHTGEIESFPDAQIIVTLPEHLAATKSETSYLLVSEEYDQVRTWQFVNFMDAQPLGTFLAHHDVFQDGSIVLLDVTGATAGGLAVLVRLSTGPVLLCGNLAGTTEHYLYARFPTLLFDRQAWWEKIWRLKKFKDLVSTLTIFPDHEWPSGEAAKRKDIVLHPSG